MQRWDLTVKETTAILTSCTQFLVVFITPKYTVKSPGTILPGLFAFLIKNLWNLLKKWLTDK